MASIDPLCPECGAPRPRRAAGCAHCGAIFDSGLQPSVAAGTQAAHAGRPARELADEPAPAPARGRSCAACLLLAAIVAALTLLAGVFFFFLVRRELTPLFRQFERTEAESQLRSLAERIEAFADRHGGRLPEDLFEVSQERVDSLDEHRPHGLEGPISRPDAELPATQSLDLIDPWGGRITYRRDSERGPARLTSLGADGQVGGTGLDADLERVLPAR